MKDIKLFYLRYCPYCRKAIKYLEELKNENEKYSKLVIEKIEESENKKLSDSYDYFLVPTFYINGQKVFEGAMDKSDVKNVLEACIKE